ncbi:hypothetical protein CO024_02295 [Candidatus Gracilibacteria bacterium CG_4_9_14_0_2_um_filter_38_7]|nr:MAG: hypothetical protein AUJ87_00135 [Candidatus Gracilibacteria bacterium CG1_02_38_174]PIQ12343.1 MAG: hypothetical protein COW68_00160 [Candidatus Gracilibacteria bacterium CG18_big_fil_WC_8_21_14_2_50_38_16]PIQ41921.1 MAG: hypothetical protein COW06_01385 [Candidatus Gracilibacteria bacterium CG12_big_fil_rev_8_21_14_0_65_38_15]PIZ01705.1 MAG: hypothetical protein COY60_02155 [Candidatus Gracilibacteria bacterium CG_4_10_14_0_8_um_filter_38_28]PJC56580.1 MAG: hypothetical protein CO024_
MIFDILSPYTSLSLYISHVPFMKKILTILLISSFSFSFFSAFAANDTTTSAKADHFEVSIKSPIQIGEATDVVVKVLDKSGAIKKDYLGTIYIVVDNDSRATIPYVDDGYTFKNSDQGVITFSKGLSFTKEGKMKITVIDAEDDNLEGTASVTVTVANNSSATGNETVTVTSPDNNSEIPSDSTTVTGSAKKNSKIQIWLNGKQAGETQTGDDGKFIYELKNIDQEQNILQIKLLDGTDAVIGESAKISFKVSAGGPIFNTVTVKEGSKVAVGTLLNLEISAEAKLEEVTATIGDSTGTFKETKDGIYVGTLTAPTATGSFQVSVSLKNSLGKITTKVAAATIETTEAPNPFKNIKSEVVPKKVTFTFGVETEPTELAKFKFQYGTESGTLSKESITFDKEKIKTASGMYQWYIANLDPETKYFRILGLDKDGKELAGMKASDIFVVDLSLAAASKCMVSNIAGLNTTERDGTTILSWDATPDATSGYNVYKKDIDGKYIFIENVPTNNYTIHIAKDTVKYDDFAVTGVCNNGEGESPYLTEVTNVKTGPAQLFALLALSAFIGFLVMRRRFAFFKGN